MVVCMRGNIDSTKKKVGSSLLLIALLIGMVIPVAFTGCVLDSEEVGYTIVNFDGNADVDGLDFDGSITAGESEAFPHIADYNSLQSAIEVNREFNREKLGINDDFVSRAGISYDTYSDRHRADFGTYDGVWLEDVDGMNMFSDEELNTRNQEIASALGVEELANNYEGMSISPLGDAGSTGGSGQSSSFELLHDSNDGFGIVADGSSFDSFGDRMGDLAPVGHDVFEDEYSGFDVSNEYIGNVYVFEITGIGPRVEDGELIYPIINSLELDLEVRSDSAGIENWRSVGNISNGDGFVEAYDYMGTDGDYDGEDIYNEFSDVSFSDDIFGSQYDNNNVDIIESMRPEVAVFTDFPMIGNTIDDYRLVIDEFAMQELRMDEDNIDDFGSGLIDNNDIIDLEDDVVEYFNENVIDVMVAQSYTSIGDYTSSINSELYNIFSMFSNPVMNSLDDSDLGWIEREVYGSQMGALRQGIGQFDAMAEYQDYINKFDLLLSFYNGYIADEISDDLYSDIEDVVESRYTSTANDGLTEADWGTVGWNFGVEVEKDSGRLRDEYTATTTSFEDGSVGFAYINKEDELIGHTLDDAYTNFYYADDGHNIVRKAFDYNLGATFLEEVVVDMVDEFESVMDENSETSLDEIEDWYADGDFESISENILDERLIYTEDGDVEFRSGVPILVRQGADIGTNISTDSILPFDGEEQFSTFIDNYNSGYLTDEVEDYIVDGIEDMEGVFSREQLSEEFGHLEDVFDIDFENDDLEDIVNSVVDVQDGVDDLVSVMDGFGDSMSDVVGDDWEMQYGSEGEAFISNIDLLVEDMENLKMRYEDAKAEWEGRIEELKEHKQEAVDYMNEIGFEIGWGDDGNFEFLQKTYDLDEMGIDYIYDVNIDTPRRVFTDDLVDMTFTELDFYTDVDEAIPVRLDIQGSEGAISDVVSAEIDVHGVDDDVNVNLADIISENPDMRTYNIPMQYNRNIFGYNDVVEIEAEVVTENEYGGLDTFKDSTTVRVIDRNLDDMVELDDWISEVMPQTYDSFVDGEFEDVNEFFVSVAEETGSSEFVEDVIDYDLGRYRFEIEVYDLDEETRLPSDLFSSRRIRNEDINTFDSFELSWGFMYVYGREYDVDVNVYDPSGDVYTVVDLGTFVFEPEDMSETELSGFGVDDELAEGLNVDDSWNGWLGVVGFFKNFRWW